jgi:hypothetical protein
MRPRGEIMNSETKHSEDDDQKIEVTDATRRAEEREFEAAHDADRPATSDEEALLDDRSIDPAVREHYNEMTERGANERGEGRID